MNQNFWTLFKILAVTPLVGFFIVIVALVIQDGPSLFLAKISYMIGK